MKKHSKRDTILVFSKGNSITQTSNATIVGNYFGKMSIHKFESETVIEELASV